MVIDGTLSLSTASWPNGRLLRQAPSPRHEPAGNLRPGRRDPLGLRGPLPGAVHDLDRRPRIWGILRELAGSGLMCWRTRATQAPVTTCAGIPYWGRNKPGGSRVGDRPDLGFYAARCVSVRRPPRTGRRLPLPGRSATGWSGRGGRSSRLRWGRRLVVGRAYSARTSRRCRSPKISIRSITSVRAVAQLFGIACARGSGAGSSPPRTGTGEDRVKSSVQLPGPVADQDRKSARGRRGP